MKDNFHTVKVGVGVLIFKGKQVLLGKRKNSHGSQEWGGPGGHVEYGETIEQTALREIAEECGVRVKGLRLLCISDLLRYWPKHYVDIGFAAEWESGEPMVLEPDKTESWQWYDLNALPQKLFGRTPDYFNAYKAKKTLYIADKNTHSLLI